LAEATYFVRVFVRVGKLFLILALVASLGAHWVALQTVAWTTMLAENFHSDTFQHAVEKTFDGRHPCCLCKAIAAAKQSEKKSEIAAMSLKLEFPPAPDGPSLFAPTQFRFLPQADAFFDSWTNPPLTPPPRASFA
jgi:hypothetical protein